MITKYHRLASLLGDNPHRAFSYDELRLFTKAYSIKAVYHLICSLREAGMNIEVKNNTVTYKG